MTTTVGPAGDLPTVTALQELDRPVVPRSAGTRELTSWLSVAWLAIVVALAICAPWLPISDSAIPVGGPRRGPSPDSLDLLLGTDQFGRSMLSRIIAGGRVSLMIGVIAAICGASIGIVVGLIAGHFRGRVDTTIMILTDTVLAFPPMILLLALSAMLRPSVSTLLIGLSLLVVPTFVRLTRAGTIQWSTREFVRAATGLGATTPRVMAREVLPNVLPMIAAYLPVVIAGLIVAEGGLSFLGLGMPPPTPSWGGMISGGRDAIGESPHLVFVPAAVIFLTVFALNQCGDFLRRRLESGS